MQPTLFAQGYLVFRVHSQTERLLQEHLPCAALRGDAHAFHVAAVDDTVEHRGSGFVSRGLVFCKVRSMAKSSSTKPAGFEIDGLFDGLELDAESVFTDPRIQVWRALPDRENALLDHQRPDGTMIRFHIKRYPATAGAIADREMAGYRLLVRADVPAAPIIAHGRLADGRSFIILQDLAGYTPGDKSVERGLPFERILSATAALAARLHNARLHHRDLYLCHFMIRESAEGVDAKLIDMARVAELKNPLTRQRWIVKDLAQFWYSTTKLNVTDEQRTRWFTEYCRRRGIAEDRLHVSVKAKSATIARHDVRLNRRQPERNVSIPSNP
jgi:hypothetical protein